MLTVWSGMDRNDAIAQLQAHAAEIRAMGVTSLYLYGSTVRNEAQLESDVDVFIDYDLSGQFSAFDLVGIKLFLEDRLGAKVDVATRNGLHPVLRDRIEDTAVRVF